MSDARWDPAFRFARYQTRKSAGLPRLVTQGDSWFDYPEYTNVVDAIDDREEFAILRFEKSGKTLLTMGGELAIVSRSVHDELPGAVLLSAGGDDVVLDHADRLFLPFDSTKTAAEHINRLWFDMKIANMRKGLEELTASVGRVAPVVAHGYDYITPVNRGAKYDGVTVAGPWLWKAMMMNAYTDAAFRFAVAKVLIDEFNALLHDLAGQHPLSFVHLDLRGKFQPSDWENEIHLRKRGFGRVARAYLDWLHTGLPLLQADRRKAGLEAH